MASWGRSQQSWKTKTTSRRAQRPSEVRWLREGSADGSPWCVPGRTASCGAGEAPGERAVLRETYPILTGVQIRNACSYLLAGGRGKAGEPFWEAHGSPRGVHLGGSSCASAERGVREKRHRGVAAIRRKGAGGGANAPRGRCLNRSAGWLTVESSDHNRYIDVKPGLVFSERKGNSRDYSAMQECGLFNMSNQHRRVK